MSRFLKHKNLKLNTRKGFTLVELMVTVTILSLGVVSVYEGFFTSLNAHAYCRNYLSVQSWMNQKIWDIQEALLRYQTLVTQKKSGNFKIGGKEFKWGLHYYSLAGSEKINLYKIILEVNWKEGIRDINVNRSTFLHYIKEQK